MNKRSIHTIIASSLLALSACNDTGDAVVSIDPVLNPIALNTGMAEEGSRAITTLPEGTQLATLPEGTKLFLVMKADNLQGSDEKWTMTEATTGTPTAQKASPVVFGSNTMRYWDDIYAREAAVSVWGVCTPNGNNVAPTIGGKSAYSTTYTPTANAWTTDANSLTITGWTVKADQSSANPATNVKNFYDQDLCYTNNTADNTPATDSRMKFRNGRFDQGELVFYHALTKVTVEMEAGNGFDAAGGKLQFAKAPSAIIHGFDTKGDLNIATGEMSNISTPAADLTMRYMSSDKSGQAEVATLSAIVMPGKTLAANDKIATVSADGSTYNITAEALVNAMPDSKTMLQGTEYVIKVRISKTGVKVAAYIKDWLTVEAAQVEPVIDVTTSWGTTEGTAKEDVFSLFLSESLSTGYGTGNAPFAANSIVAKNDSKWVMTPQLYWRNHQVGYFLRSVWPQTKTEGEGGPKVTTSTTTGNPQVIAVENVAYSANTYPSDLMIGIPSNEPATGITATEGTINMTFKYAMTKVEVRLKTPETGTDKVNLTNAKVEIVNGYTTGEVKMADRGIVNLGGKGDYLIPATATANTYLAAIVPQQLTFTTADAATNLRFKITIDNGDGTTDVYYRDIKPIAVKEGSVTQATTAWEAGKHYVYTLNMRKTKIDITATITDWITVAGSTDTWF